MFSRTADRGCCEQTVGKLTPNVHSLEEVAPFWPLFFCGGTGPVRGCVAGWEGYMNMYTCTSGGQRSTEARDDVRFIGAWRPPGKEEVASMWAL